MRYIIVASEKRSKTKQNKINSLSHHQRGDSIIHKRMMTTKEWLIYCLREPSLSLNEDNDNNNNNNNRGFLQQQFLLLKTLLHFVTQLLVGVVIAVILFSFIVRTILEQQQRRQQPQPKVSVTFMEENYLYTTPNNTTISTTITNSIYSLVPSLIKIHDDNHSNNNTARDKKRMKLISLVNQVRMEIEVPNDHNNEDYYYQTQLGGTLLGRINYTNAIANPLKGLTVNPDTIQSKVNALMYRIPHSLESYYVGLDTVLMPNGSYNWTHFELRLNRTANRSAHAIPRFYIHYPGEPLRLPAYVIKKSKLVSYSHFGTPTQYMTPHYGDEYLLNVLEKFIDAFGKKYDGDERIACIQMGLLGFWGEWHVGGNPFYLPDRTRELVLKWYTTAFRTTKLQTRYPMRSVYNKIQNKQYVGYHDDSFTYATLDGIYNGGENRSFFFWPYVTSYNQTTFWKTNVMGGEIRPENSEIIYHPTYPANTPYHQDIMKCITMTHTTYMKQSWFFRSSEQIQLVEIKKGLDVTAHMGYNFIVTALRVFRMDPMQSDVGIDITIQQIGIAPFYYPLDLIVQCPTIVSSSLSSSNDTKKWTIQSIENDLIDQYESRTYRINEVPMTSECLSNLSIQLHSPYFFPENKLRFTQGTTGYLTNISIPLPKNNNIRTIQPQSSSSSSPLPPPSPISLPISPIVASPLSKSSSSPQQPRPPPTGREMKPTIPSPPTQPPRYAPPVIIKPPVVFVSMTNKPVQQQSPQGVAVVVPVPVKKPSTTNRRGIIEFILVNARDDIPIGIVRKNSIINLAQLPTLSLSLEANIDNSLLLAHMAMKGNQTIQKINQTMAYHHHQQQQQQQQQQQLGKMFDQHPMGMPFFYVEFHWVEHPGRITRKKVELTPPYCLGGNKVQNYQPAKYLSYRGKKNLIIYVKQYNRKQQTTTSTSTNVLLLPHPNDIILATKVIQFKVVNRINQFVPPLRSVTTLLTGGG